MSYERPLFIESLEDFSALARTLHQVAFSDFQCERRDGLNLGGGEYFLFSRDKLQIAFVSNDREHAEVYRPDREGFPFYCYVLGTSDSDILDFAQTKLREENVSCRVLPAD